MHGIHSLTIDGVTGCDCDLMLGTAFGCGTLLLQTTQCKAPGGSSARHPGHTASLVGGAGGPDDGGSGRSDPHSVQYLCDKSDERG